MKKQKTFLFSILSIGVITFLTLIIYSHDAISIALIRYFPHASSEWKTNRQKTIEKLEALTIKTFHSKNNKSTISGLSQLIEIDPYNQEYHFALGLNLRKKENHNEALRFFKTSTKHPDLKPLSHTLRAESSLALGKEQKAIEQLKEASLNGRFILKDIKSFPILRKLKDHPEIIKIALFDHKYKIRSKRIQDPMTSWGGGGFKCGFRPDSTTQLSWDEQLKLMNDSQQKLKQLLWFKYKRKKMELQVTLGKLKKLLGKTDQVSECSYKENIERVSARLAKLKLD